MTISTFIIFFLNGLTNGMLLFLISAGLTLIFGVMGILNFAHGSLYMLGAYLTFSFVTHGLNFWLALIFAPLTVAIIGGIIESIFLRRIYHEDISFQLLLTFAFVLLINDLVRLVWGSAPLTTPTPELFAVTVQIFDRPYPAYNLLIIILAPLVGINLWLFLSKTRLGKMMRAVAQDKVMAGALGINVPQLFTLVFMLGAWLGGVAGVLVAPLRTLNPAMADNVIIESFIITVIGGLGSLPGALVGALLLGLINSFGILIAPRAQVAFPFILMAITLLFRPQGLFGKIQR
ncbi:MAG: branched-chain amino acid ABC transporter permease [Microcoleaceae cyanobacterium MO_207.B10]|nr:branched-chain amino acid ABC transporter permease [Microcoleaceae cyanobacterium MO_207.B10]